MWKIVLTCSLMASLSSLSSLSKICCILLHFSAICCTNANFKENQLLEWRLHATSKYPPQISDGKNKGNAKGESEEGDSTRNPTEEDTTQRIGTEEKAAERNGSCGGIASILTHKGAGMHGSGGGAIDTNLCTIHTKHVMIMPKDIHWHSKSMGNRPFSIFLFLLLWVAAFLSPVHEVWGIVKWGNL